MTDGTEKLNCICSKISFKLDMINEPHNNDILKVWDRMDHRMDHLEDHAYLKQSFVMINIQIDDITCCVVTGTSLTLSHTDPVSKFTVACTA